MSNFSRAILVSKIHLGDLRDFMTKQGDVMKVIFFLALVLGIQAYGETGACTIPWSLQLDASSFSTPKPYGDSSNASYSSFMFSTSSAVRLVLKGKFPKYQFTSIQTQSTTAQSDVIFDYQIVPDAGSVNPMVPPATLTASNRDFTLELRPEGSTPKASNSIFYKMSATQVFTMRAYAPFNGISMTREDLPKVYAYDEVTLKPVACPKFVPIPNAVPVEFSVSALYSLFSALAFKKSGAAPATGSTDRVVEFRSVGTSELGNANQATTYLYSNNEMKKGGVAVFRLKATPTFTDTYSGLGTLPSGKESRGWSVCSLDFQTAYNFGCLPDHFAKVGKDGYVTIVVGNSEAVKQRALAQEANFFPDTRLNQDILGNEVVSMSFYLRNLLPNCEFAKNKMYKGDYCPSALICSEQEYLLGKCVPTAAGNCIGEVPAPANCP